MKQLYLGALRIRLLYGVVIVLTTCLLIVGVTHRLRMEEAERRTADVTAQYHAEKKAHQDVLNRLERWKSKNPVIPRNTVWCDTGESPDELKHYIRAMEKRLKAYEDAYPEPESVKRLREDAIERGLIAPMDVSLSEAFVDFGTRINVDMNEPISITEGQRVKQVQQVRQKMIDAGVIVPGKVSLESGYTLCIWPLRTAQRREAGLKPLIFVPGVTLIDR